MRYNHLFRQHIEKYDFSQPYADTIRYIMLANSSYFRPSLTLAWCEEIGGDVETALDLALAVECIHVASLLHDDLPCMDNAITRRDKFCLHLIDGEAKAILTGDRLIFEAYSIILFKANLGENQREAAIKFLTTAGVEMIDGQYYDLFIKNKNQEEYLKTCLKKTAVLIDTACVMGVISHDLFNAEVFKSEILKASRFGTLLGLLYQVIDDIHDQDYDYRENSYCFNEQEGQQLLQDISSYINKIELKNNYLKQLSTYSFK